MRVGVNNTECPQTLSYDHTPSPRVSWVESGHETNQPDPFPRERVGSRHETSNFIVVAALTWQNVEL